MPQKNGAVNERQRFRPRVADVESGGAVGSRPRVDDVESGGAVGSRPRVADVESGGAVGSITTESVWQHASASRSPPRSSDRCGKLNILQVYC